MHIAPQDNQNKPIARTFNPVLMKFTNPAEERSRVEKDHTQTMRRMNVAKDKQLVYEVTRAFVIVVDLFT